MQQLHRELRERLGPSVTFDEEVRRAYNHDQGEVPYLLMSMIRSVPDVVVAARHESDVAETLKIAKRFNLPVTPRGQASSGYGGAIPTRGGILLDLSEMNRILKIDKDAAMVDVQPGVIWNLLSRKLNQQGLDNRICPTSAPSSTIGGWFAMGGVGLGSLKYGSIRDVVQEIDVVGLDGLVTTYAGDAVEVFHQTCGILGIITRLRLLCRPAEALRPYAILLQENADLAAFLARARNVLSPYSISLKSSGYLKMRGEAEGHPPLTEQGFLATVVIPAGLADDVRVAQTAKVCGGRLLSQEVADLEWANRFYPMRVKKIGPSMMVSEFFIPEVKFQAVWKAVRAQLSGDVLGMEAMAVSNQRLAVQVYILHDAQEPLYLLRMAKALVPLRIAARLGGSIYACGMWFAAGSKKLWGEAKYEAVMECKRRVDPGWLLNPGKIQAPRMPWFPVMDLSRLIQLGTAVMAPLTRRLAGKRFRPS